MTDGSLHTEGSSLVPKSPPPPRCQPTFVVFLLVFAPFKIKLLLNRLRVHWVLSKFRKSFEQHPKTLPAYLINRPGWMGCLHLGWHCCCAAKFSSLENISPQSSDTLGLRTNNAQNLTLARAFVRLVSVFLYLRLVFVCLTMCRSTCRVQKCNTCARACICVCGQKVEEVKPWGGLLHWDTAGARGHCKERGGRNPHLHMNFRPVRDRGGWDLSLNIRLRGLRQMIGISSALPTTSDCLSLYLLSVRLVPPVPPN